jgi:hypothetical protein
VRRRAQLTTAYAAASGGWESDLRDVLDALGLLEVITT